MKKNTKYILGALGLIASYLYFKKKKKGGIEVEEPVNYGQQTVLVEQPDILDTVLVDNPPIVIEQTDMGDGLSLRADATYEEVTSGNRRVILHYLNPKRSFHIEYNPIGTSSDERLDGKWAMVYNADHKRTPNTWLMKITQSTGLLFARQATVTKVSDFEVYM